MKYDVVLLNKPFGLPGRAYGYGLTKRDVLNLFDLLTDYEAYPIEIHAKGHESSAMGFISAAAAHKIDYEYMTVNEPGGLYEFVARILDDMENKSVPLVFMFKGLKVWLGR